MVAIAILRRASTTVNRLAQNQKYNIYTLMSENE